MRSKNFVEDAVNQALTEVTPDRGGFRRLVEQGGEFKKELAALIARLAVSKKFIK